MRLRSFSLSKIIPVEIINLIIHESSCSTLHAWTLVSFGCLSVAGPLLNEDVHLRDQKQILRVLRRITLDDNNPSILLLPRLALPLSLKNVRRLSFHAEPHPISVEALARAARSSQPERVHLELVFSWAARLKKGKERTTFRSFLAPTLLKLLQPGSFSEGPNSLRSVSVVRVSSWALHAYLIFIDRWFPTLLSQYVPFTSSTVGSILERTYRSVVDFQECRDNIRALLSKKAPGYMEPEEEQQRLEWLEQIEVLDREEANRLEGMKREGRDVGDGLDILIDASATASAQLDGILAFLSPITERNRKELES